MRNHQSDCLLAVVLFLAALAPTAALAQQDIINTVAGGGPNNIPALQANVNYPQGVATDNAGNYYVSTNSCRIFKVNSAGTLTLVAGNGFCGYRGDGGPATQAELSGGDQLAVDSSGNIYITDQCVIRKVDTSGNINVFAGTPGACNYGGDGGPATAAGAYLYFPRGVAVDSAGNVYIADQYNHRIRKVDTSGNLTTIAGGCYGYSGDGGPATSACMTYPEAVAVDKAGNVYYADLYNYVIRDIDTSGNSNTVAGVQTSGCAAGGGDGGPATSATFCYIYGLAADQSTPANIFVADYYDYAIRTFQVGGNISSAVGTPHNFGYAGDGGPATSAHIGYLLGLAVDSFDNIFDPEYDFHVVRKAALGGNINTVAGNGTLNFAGNNVPATDAELSYPWGVAADTAGNFYVADSNNCVIRKVDGSGTITLFAGTVNVCGFGGDGGPATSAYLAFPTRVAVDKSGNVYISDTSNLRIRKVDTTGMITTIAGSGNAGFCGDGGPATSACLYYPYGVTIDPRGNLYIADLDNERVRKVDTTGTISTVAGTGNCTYDGEGPATAHSLCTPYDVAADFAGNVYIADYSNQRVRKLDTSGILSTWAGNGSCCNPVNNTPADQTQLGYPIAVATDPAGDVLIGGVSENLVVLVDGSQMLHFLAGQPFTYQLFGDGGLATSAALTYPYGLGSDPSGNTYIADINNQRIRKVSAIANLNASDYDVTFNVQPVGTQSSPQLITLAATGPISFGGITISDLQFQEEDNCSGISSGQSCAINFFFKPSKPGVFNATASVASNSFFGSPFTITLSGNGTAIAVAPSTLVFSPTAIGLTSTAKNVKVTNKSNNTTLTFGTITVSSNFQLVAAGTSPCGASLAPLASCNLAVRAAPQQAGALAGTLAINDSDGSSPQLVTLSVTAPLATVTPTKFNYGTHTVGTTSFAIVTVRYNGPGTMTLSGPTFTGTNATDFFIAPGGSCSASLTSGSKCTYKVAFKPSVVGPESATMQVNDSSTAGTGPQLVGLSGTGQ